MPRPSLSLSLSEVLLLSLLCVCVRKEGVHGCVHARSLKKAPSTTFFCSYHRKVSCHLRTRARAHYFMYARAHECAEAESWAIYGATSLGSRRRRGGRRRRRRRRSRKSPSASASMSLSRSIFLFCQCLPSPTRVLGFVVSVSTSSTELSLLSCYVN